LSINSEIFHKNSKNLKMKKLFVVLAVASLGFVACNNEASTEDAAKKTADSIRVADSLAKISSDAASEAQALDAKRVADSIRVADSLAALKTPAKK
jgi:hypothetical protein